MNIKAITIHDVRNPGPDLGETQLYDGVELVNNKKVTKTCTDSMSLKKTTHMTTQTYPVQWQGQWALVVKCQLVKKEQYIG